MTDIISGGLIHRLLSFIKNNLGIIAINNLDTDDILTCSELMKLAERKCYILKSLRI